MRVEKIDPVFKRQVWHSLMFLVGVIILNRLSAGGGLVFLILASIGYAATRKVGRFMTMYMMIPFLTELDSGLVGTGAMFRYGGRIAVFSSTILMLLQYANSKGRYTLPIGGLFVFLACACISSIDGYCPIVSYLKIVNFSVFILGLYFGGRMISENFAELNRMRASIMAAAIFLIFGSVMMYFVPSIGYMSGRGMIAQGYTEQQIAAQIAAGGLNLFKGVTNHSQTLAVMLVVFVGWLICDMFFVEQRLTNLHLIIITASLPLFQMTGSRTALVGFFSLCFVLMFFSVPRARIPLAAKRRIKGLMLTGAILLFTLAVVMEFSGGGISRWLRKTDDTSDGRGLIEAVTSTRMGLVEMGMAEFRSKPLLGVGFQVNEDSAEHARRQGFVISAPVERGVLPIAILAEGGVLGAISFLIFLVMFYCGCIRQRFVATMTLFTVYLILNLSECTFFSPNGGGTQWIILLIGGFVIDIYGKALERYRSYYGR